MSPKLFDQLPSTDRAFIEYAVHQNLEPSRYTYGYQGLAVVDMRAEVDAFDVRRGTGA